MIKKMLCILLVFVMVASTVCFAKSGDVAGNYYYTDIKTYVRGQLIDSFNVGGKTVIVCENLDRFGFIVAWDSANRKLSIEDNKGKVTGNPTVETVKGALGDIAGEYYFTDIKTFFAGKEIESYNIGGYTVFPATLLRDFGYTVEWDETNRRVLIDTDSSTAIGSTKIDNLTYKENQIYHGDILVRTNAPSFNGTYPITSHDCMIETSLDKYTYIPFQAFADCLGIGYSWDSETATLTVNVPDDSVIKASKSNSKASVKAYTTKEFEIKDIVLNIKNGTDTFKDLKAIAYGDEVFVESNDLALGLKFFVFNNSDFYTSQMAYLLYSGIYK